MYLCVSEQLTNGTRCSCWILCVECACKRDVQCFPENLDRRVPASDEEHSRRQLLPGHLWPRPRGPVGDAWAAENTPVVLVLVIPLGATLNQTPTVGVRGESLGEALWAPPGWGRGSPSCRVGAASPRTSGS